ncbi:MULTISPECIES: hypothetical protein [unclassified Luteococcus]|uniref:hypothetical protein n=1 Tax=unclassified Luteococcus TaxID=2639923 RepID=UPI00313A8E8F
MRTRSLVVVLIAMSASAGCLKPAPPLAEDPHAVLSAHTYGRPTGSWNPTQESRLVLRASCTGKGTLHVEAQGQDRLSVDLACPGNLEQAGVAVAVRRTVTLTVRGDAKTVDGWAQLVPARS